MTAKATKVTISGGKSIHVDANKLYFLFFCSEKRKNHSASDVEPALIEYSFDKGRCYE